MYLVVIGILALILTLSGPVYRGLVDPGQIVAAVAAATLLPPAVGLLVTRRVLRTLERYPDVPSHGQAAFGRGMVIIQALLAVCHAGVFVFTDWLPLCDRTPVVGAWPVVPALLALVPFLLSIVLIWLAVYAADRAVRQIALEVYLFRGKPVRPIWPLVQYVLYNLRHQVLFILVPMLLIVAATDLAQRHRKAILQTVGVPHADELLVGLAALLVAVVTPEILRHVWVTQRLPEGPLRDRLVRLAGKLRLRCRDILVWRSGGMIVNAAVMGIVAPLRYVLITDGMLEQMDDTKIEAVFGHEAGHIKRHHILFFLMFAFISGCIMTIFSLHAQDVARRDLPAYRSLRVALLVALLAAKWGLMFGWVSRKFERQADMFGVRTLALSGLPCALPCVVHAPTANPAGRPASTALCSTAAHVFADALQEVAVLNGIRPEARSWRHSSISYRSRFLQELAQNPARAARVERGVLAVKIGILLVAVIAGAWAAYELRLWATLLHWLPGT